MNLPTAEELKNHLVFGTLDEYSLERLLQVARLEELGRNEVIYEAGDRAEKISLVLEGTLKTTAVAANQREVILDILGPGDLVGEDAASMERRSAGASVMRDAALLTFPAAAIRALWTRNPDFTAAWTHYVSGTKERLQDRVAEMAYGNIEDRLFRMLVHLAHYHGTKTKKGNTVIRFALTHQELANLIGATRETTTLAVGRLKASGAIGFIDRKVVLKDKLRLDAPQEEKAG